MSNRDFAIDRRRMLASAAALTAAPLLVGAGLATPARAAEAKLGAWQPRHWRYKVGGFEMTVIADSEVFIDGPYPIIGKNAEEADVRKLMRDNLLPEAKYQPGFSPTVINTGRELVLFDTGNGENGFVPRPNGGWLAAGLAPAGIKPEDIDVVVLSHGHPDHVGGMIEAGKPLFPNARYVIGQVEYDFWAPEGKHTGDIEKFAAVFRANTKALADKFTFLKPGDEVVPGIRALEAFGHTPGHLNFHIESEGQAIYFWGDCAHHQVASLMRPDWHCVFDADKEQAATTRKRVFDMLATDRIPVIGYHMPFPSVGYIERKGPGAYGWLAHTYQLNL
ncbi:MBL fold metallo-hydrolase [Hyphomicrobium sp. LHD-15]|uniref:MBL fold metallo-hydrolase n=1 Tax=Hyphomicrobium sp. LHD-15 TaxID=3072142 RepID=UPI00280D9305|nr:MBL fold metallo-hydrolase [Hyphomicrobium sp. LHD-15]MDQ8700445.1 MBL fold metallo-hydrolase [Hyphomicrobium sp. LHD-15]